MSRQSKVLKIILALCFLTCIFKDSWAAYQPRIKSKAKIKLIHFTENVKPKEIQTIVNLLSQCPEWNGQTVSNSQTNAQVMEQLAKISKFNLIQIREAIEYYAEESKKFDFSYRERMGSVFLLNRYLFNIPPGLQKYKKYFWGVTGAPSNDGEVDWLWPFTKDSKGALLLTGFPIFFRGTEYQALEEFDFFNKKYKARITIKTTPVISKLQKANRKKRKRL